jgi:hypothetical protein
MTKSVLRRKPDVIEYPDDNGGTTCIVAGDWLMGQCANCNRMFMVESNIGDLRCPHGCDNVKITWVWVKHQTIYIPEHEPVEIIDGTMQKPK